MPKPKKSNASKKQKLSQATLEEIFKGAGQTKKSKSKRDVNASESELGEKSDEGLGDIHFERKASAVTTDDDVDALEVSSPKRSLKRRKVVNSDDDQDQPMPPLSSPTSHIQITDSEEDEVIPIRKSKRSKQNVVADSDDDDARPRKRKLRKKPQSPTTSDEDLAGEVEEERILDSRLRQRGKTSVFQKNLEKLRRRKQGRTASSSSEMESEVDATTYRVTPFDGAKPGGSEDFDDESEGTQEQENDDFIVEDDGAGFTELPVEFSMSTHEDLAHQFKIIFQFFVHIAIQPPEDRHKFMSRQMKSQQYFSVPLQIVRRKLSGLRDSLVASSVWRADFKTALSTFPEFGLDDLQFALPQCDACHLGGRLSTLIGRLSGHPYDPVGFESKMGDSSDEDESPLQFHLGRFCARRTRVFHQFSHWEHALFCAIRQEIDELYERSRAGSSKRNFVRIAFAGATQPPDDLTDADAICEYLDSRKVIDMEWQSIKSMMDSAQNLEMARKKGDDTEG
ncbi:hypothetical protein EYR40_000834 [Pleurotus pulmonarius]|nr:hypothetical protein EYR36_004568 [Pleurotus pulmonarius]KAF4579002.1 hypothetical protein EYR36_000811 [Pleurotus pulmonarius]KAF4603666.1 hypothetical protein EYR38_004081 [Pleurotus pulmonarius]KAF4608489.1 hypothetical protein EYR40_000834 [Pleurotus pulmonarius]